MSSFRSPPTENWDDDFLFQNTPPPPPPPKSLQHSHSHSRSESPPDPHPHPLPHPSSSRPATSSSFYSPPRLPSDATNKQPSRGQGRGLDDEAWVWERDGERDGDGNGDRNGDGLGLEGKHQSGPSSSPLRVAQGSSWWARAERGEDDDDDDDAEDETAGDDDGPGTFGRSFTVDKAKDPQQRQKQKQENEHQYEKEQDQEDEEEDEAEDWDAELSIQPHPKSPIPLSSNFNLPSRRPSVPQAKAQGGGRSPLVDEGEGGLGIRGGGDGGGGDGIEKNVSGSRSGLGIGTGNGNGFGAEVAAGSRNVSSQSDISALSSLSNTTSTTTTSTTSATSGLTNSSSVLSGLSGISEGSRGSEGRSLILEASEGSGRSGGSEVGGSTFGKGREYRERDASEKGKHKDKDREKKEGSGTSRFVKRRSNPNPTPTSTIFPQPHYPHSPTPTPPLPSSSNNPSKTSLISTTRPSIPRLASRKSLGKDASSSSSMLVKVKTPGGGGRSSFDFGGSGSGSGSGSVGREGFLAGLGLGGGGGEEKGMGLGLGMGMGKKEKRKSRRKEQMEGGGAGLMAVDEFLLSSKDGLPPLPPPSSTRLKPANLPFSPSSTNPSPDPSLIASPRNGQGPSAWSSGQNGGGSGSGLGLGFKSPGLGGGAGQGKGGTFFGRVVSLHKRFSSTSAPNPNMYTNVMAGAAGSSLNRSVGPGVGASPSAGGTPVKSPLPGSVTPTREADGPKSKLTARTPKKRPSLTVDTAPERIRSSMVTPITSDGRDRSVSKMVVGTGMPRQTSSSSVLPFGNGEPISAVSTPDTAETAQIDGLPPVKAGGNGRPVNMSERRLATSPSLQSLGFHLPSPSMGSPYSTAVRGKKEDSRRRLVDSPLQGYGDSRDAEIIREEELTPKKSKRRPTSMQSPGKQSRASSVEMDSRQASSSSYWSTISSGTAVTELSTLSSGMRQASGQSLDLAEGADNDKRMSTFKFGVSSRADNLVTTARASSSSSLERGRDEPPRAASVLPVVPEKKRKSTLKRLSSLSRKHGRKVSDGWRFVSGGSTISSESDKRKVSDALPTASSGDSTFDPDPSLLSASLPPSTTTLPTALELASPVKLAPHPSVPRAMSHNSSPSSSKNSGHSGGSGHMAEEKATSSPGSAHRRVSLSDLRIPSRVVSMQKGLREGIMAARQFATCVQDLKALTAQRAIMDANAARKRAIGMNTGSELLREDIAKRFESWWDLADMLIQLGETGSLDSPASKPTEAEIKKDRRSTYAAEAPNSSTPSPTQIKRILGQAELTPSASEPANGGNLAAAAGWTAAIGRSEFSQKQVQLLKGILASPDSADAEQDDEPAFVLPPVTPRRASGRPLSPLSPAFRLKSSKGHGPPPPVTPTSISQSARRSSRAGFFNLKDLWKNMPKNQSNPMGAGRFHTTRASLSPPSANGIGTQDNDSPKSPTRPSLANIFRRTSSTATTPRAEPSLSQSVHSTQSRNSTRTSGRGSNASDTSDWDSFDISPSDPNVPFRVDQYTNRSSASPVRDVDHDQTIGRSESRKLLANLGVKPDVAPRRSIVNGPAELWPTNTNPRASSDPAQTVMLTPDNLLPLVQQAKDTIRECEECLKQMREAATAIVSS